MAATALPETTITPARYRFTVAQYYQLAEVGILAPDERVELIEGDIIKMAAIGPTHASILDRLTRLAVRQTPPDVRVGVQNPIHIDPRTEPQPDLCLSRYRPSEDAHPIPADIYLVVEIADSTPNYDRDTKLPLYAAAGIAESWLFDVRARLLERHSEPQDGVYRRIDRAGRGQSLASTTLPALTLAVDELLR